MRLPNWKPLPQHAKEQATLVRGVQRYARDLVAVDPWLPFPQNGCCYAFGPEGRSLPIGALLLLWEG